MNTKTTGIRFAMALASITLATPALTSAAACVVGTGTSVSCTEVALDACLPGGARFDGTVTFDCGGAKTISVTSTKIISADSAIDGGSVVTIDGGTANGVLLVSADVTLTLDDVTVSGGTSTGDGGAIFNLGTLVVVDAIFSHNGSGRNGGAIFNGRGATLVVSGGSFFDNTANVDGGAIRNEGRLTATDGSFVENAAGADGGAIFSDGDLTVTSSAFLSNTARIGGGAISSNHGAPTVANCTFFANQADLGGALRNDDGTPTVTNCTFSGNGATTDGGAIFSAAPFTVTAINTILANSTSGGNCGALDGLRTIIDGGHNIDDTGTCNFAGANCAAPGSSFCKTDPRLDGGPASNGGPTQTIALEPGSLAIDAGDESICAGAPVSNLDQRGFVRPGAGAASCSIGAYEFRAVPPTTLRLGCAATPLDDCKPAGKAKTPLHVIASPSPDENRLSWTWKNGAATAFDELGDPSRTTSYRLCVYESAEQSAPVLEALAAAGGGCGKHPCWKVIPKKAVRYRDRSGSSDGLVRVIARSGKGRRATVVVRAKGAELPLPPRPLLAPVTVQLQTSDGTCWQTTDSTN